MLLAVAGDESDRRAGFALQEATERKAGFGRRHVIDVARLDRLVRIEDCGEQTLRRLVSDRREVRADLLPDAGELMAGGAVFFEELGAIGRFTVFRERDPVGIN